jgi:hypothetical protein
LIREETLMSKMREGICPQCDSRSIYHAQSDTYFGQPLSGTHITIKVGLVVKYASLDIFVCTDCGYVENYVYRSEDLNAIASTWHPVNQINNKRKNDQ